MKPRHSISRRPPFPTLILSALTFATSLQAATITDATTGIDLTDGASWGGTTPGSNDIAAWVGTSPGISLTLPTSSSWSGISVTGATGAIGITGAGTFTLGAGGIDMSFSTVHLTREPRSRLKSVKHGLLAPVGSWPHPEHPPFSRPPVLS